MKWHNFETKYMVLFEYKQKQQWENYAYDAKHDLSTTDQELYNLFTGVERLYGNDRRTWVANSIIHRGLVDNHYQVAKLRNLLDDWDNYPGDRHSKAAAMAPDVLELMKIRSLLSRELGYSCYTGLVLSGEEIEQAWIVDLLNDYLDKNLGEARRLVKAYDLKWQSWFADLRRLGGPLLGDALKSSKELLTALGLEEALDRINLRVASQPISGYVCAVDIPRDVRILVRPVDSLQQLLVLYHELGHALGHCYNQQTGVLKTFTAVHDETMAMLIEKIGLELLGDEEMKRVARDLAVLENTRCALSFLFEIDLNNRPEEAENLYRQHYGRLAGDIDSSLWALDSFRSIDPVYIHNYVLGSIIAEQAFTWLKTNLSSPKDWGKWLRDNWFATGRRESLWNKTEVVRKGIVG